MTSTTKVNVENDHSYLKGHITKKSLISNGGHKDLFYPLVAAMKQLCLGK